MIPVSSNMSHFYKDYYETSASETEIGRQVLDIAKKYEASGFKQEAFEITRQAFLLKSLIDGIEKSTGISHSTETTH